MKPKSTPPVVPVKWDERPLEWARAAGQTDLLMAAIEVRKKRQRRRRIAAAGGAAMLLVVGFMWFFALGRTPSANDSFTPTGKVLVTAPERRVLPDGCLVELRPGAEITLDFTADFRRVELIKGVAHFQVTKNVARPFVVSAGGVRFRAVGTAFSVDFGQTSVEILVTEGRVAVEKDSATVPDVTQANGQAVTTVDAGNRIVVGLELAQTSAPATVPVPTSVAETNEKLAWRIPRLEFNETPLGEVVRLLNQYSGSHISLAKPTLSRLEISGALRADNIEPLLQILEANYRIKVLRHPGGEIELTPDG